MTYEEALAKLGLNPDIRLRQMFELGKLAEHPVQRKPLVDDTCTWARPDSDHMPDTWEASCGAMWTFTEGGPKDNDMHFCPKCGKPAIEAKLEGML